MEFKISMANIKANLFFYKIYFLATIVILTIFSIFLNFLADDMIIKKISESNRVEIMSRSIYVFLLILVVFFLVYFNNFFLKKRSFEIGVLSLLGFSKVKLIKILLYESIFILSTSFLLGVLFGIFGYYIIKISIIHILYLDIPFELYIDSDVIIKLAILTFIIFTINMLINSILIMKQSLVEFVNYSKKCEIAPQIRPIMAIFSFVTIISGYIICITSYRGLDSIWKIGSTPILVFVIFLIMIGTITLFNFFVPYILNEIKKNKNKLYNPVGNIIYPKLIFRIISKKRLLIAISLLITLTVTIVGIMSFTLTYPIKVIDRLNPSSIEFDIKNLKIDNNDLNKIVKSNNANILNTTVLRVNVKPSIPITENSGKYVDFFDIVKYSDYKQLMINQGNENKIEHLERDESLLISYYPTQKPLHINFLLPNNNKININKMSLNNIFSFYNSVTTLIVSDSYYEKLKKYNIGKNIGIISINGENLRNSRGFYENFKNIKDVQSSYLKKYMIIRDNSSTFIFISFISVLLIICTACILYFTNLIDIINNKIEYKHLRKLGYSKNHIMNIIKIEIGIIYKIPVIIGIINGSFILFSFYNILVDNLVSSRDLIGTTILFFMLFIMIYFMFNYITEREAKKIIEY